MREWRLVPLICNLGNRWRVSFTLRPLCPWGRSPQYPLDRRLDGPQAALDAVEKTEAFTTVGDRTPIPRSSSPWPSHYTNWTILVLRKYLYVHILFQYQSSGYFNMYVHWALCLCCHFGSDRREFCINCVLIFNISMAQVISWKNR
jgi:hypothetical protein